MSFHNRYRTGNIPWEINRADANMVSVIKEYAITPCRVLDIGCGTGSSSVWFSMQGFEVSGVDKVDIALKAAQEKALEHGADCSFYELDFMSDEIPGSPFELAFDRGCFHHFKGRLEHFARRVAEVLGSGGLWLSLSGNADERRDWPGPPRLSASEIVNAVEPHFKVLLLKKGQFDSDSDVPPWNWICLFEKR